MTETATAPAGSDFDRADQNVPVDPDDQAGLDTGALRESADDLRGVLGPAALADRVDQSWITPQDPDDYGLAY